MEKLAVGDSLEEDKPTLLQRGPNLRIWTTIMLAGTASVALLATGALFTIGVFTLVPTPTAASLKPPRPQAPPASPTHPPQPPLRPGMMLLEQKGYCAIQVSGIWVSQIDNGRCQDGGSSSESDICSLGNDSPDCPPRSVQNVPSPPSSGTDRRRQAKLTSV